MENKQTYDTESYANNTIPELSIYNDDSRIFHRECFSYDCIISVVSASFVDGTFMAKLKLENDDFAFLSISERSDRIFRINLSYEDLESNESSELLETIPPVKESLLFNAYKDRYELVSKNSYIQIFNDPFNLKINNRNGDCILELAKERIAGEYPTPPLGFRKSREGIEPFISWKIKNDECFFGLGEKWNKVEKSSTRSTVWCTETCGSNTTDMCYKPLPLLFSTKGWGILNHTSYRSFWEIGTFSYTSGSMLTEGPLMDLFIFIAPTLKELLEVYSSISGRPSMPPRWAIGVWMSRCAYETREESDEAINGLRKYEIPSDVIHIDPLWMKTHYYFKIGVDACDFVKNDEAFPNQKQMFSDYMKQGFNTSLWINPYLPEGSPIYKEAEQKGFLLRSINGGLARLSHGEPVGMVDFTNAEAYEWWKGFLRNVLQDGASVLKPDYGDRVPEDALCADGRTGKEIHNLYTYLFTKASYEAALEVRGEGMVWRRSGYIGSQRYPGTWAGDTQSTWEGLKHCMRGGLSAGMSGEAFWSHDIGGFVGEKPSKELYIRWVQFGMLSPLTRFHGTTPREPWHYGEEAIEVTKHYSNLRYKLMPYLFSVAMEAVAKGLPIMRHMKLEFQCEPNVETLDDQYMLGSDILVCPIINEGATWRHVYLPQGKWYELESETTVILGGRFVKASAPLAEIPLFIREGSVIPKYIKVPMHLKEEAADEMVIDIFAGNSDRMLSFNEYDKKVSIVYSARNEGSRLLIDPVDLKFKIRLIGFSDINSTFSCIARTENGIFEIIVDGKEGIDISW